MVANSLPVDPSPPPPPPDPGGWVKKVENPFFSEHGHVTYQIKGNGECSNMQDIFWPFTHNHPPGSNLKTSFTESSHVAYQLKGNGK